MWLLLQLCSLKIRPVSRARTIEDVVFKVRTHFISIKKNNWKNDWLKVNTSYYDATITIFCFNDDTGMIVQQGLVSLCNSFHALQQS